MKKYLSVFLGMISLLGHAAVPMDGGVFKDALYWFTGAVDRNGDGYLSKTQGDEIRNTFCAADINSSSNKAYSAAATLDTFKIERVSVKCPYSKLTIEDASVVRSRPSDSDPRKEGEVFLATASQKLNQYSSYTVLMRARRETGSPYYSAYANVGGLRYGIMGGEGPWISFPSNDKYIGGWAAEEKWFDLAFVMNAVEKKAYVYAIYEGGNFKTVAIDYPQEYLNWTGGSDAVKMFGLYGCCPNAAFHQFAVWERALSEDEVKEAFSWPSPAVECKAQIGYRNDSAVEFASLSAITEFSASNPLSAYPNALNADCPELTTSFVMDKENPIDLSEKSEGAGARYAPRAQAIICRFAKDSGEGELEAYVNDVLVGCEIARPGGFVGYVVPANIVTDKMALKFKWKSGEDVKIDVAYVSQNSDWQIGYRNKSCFDDGFDGNYKPQYTIGRPWGEFTRCLSGRGNGNWNNIAIKVSLPEEALRFKYRVEVQWVHMAGGENPKNGIRVNGEVKALDTVGGGWTTTVAYIKPEDLREGENTIDLFRGTDIGEVAGDYDQIDYVRFEPVKYTPECGMVFIIR